MSSCSGPNGEAIKAIGEMLTLDGARRLPEAAQAMLIRVGVSQSSVVCIAILTLKSVLERSESDK